MTKHQPITVTLVNEEQHRLVQCLAPLRWHCSNVSDDDIAKWHDIAEELEFLADEIVARIKDHAAYYEQPAKYRREDA